MRYTGPHPAAGKRLDRIRALASTQNIKVRMPTSSAAYFGLRSTEAADPVSATIAASVKNAPRDLRIRPGWAILKYGAV
jgi:hypothetical protein